MNRNKIFSADDILFANVVKNGMELVSLRVTGVKSLSELVAYVRKAVGRTVGHVVMKIRNFSQGWSIQQSLWLRESPLPQGTQLTLF